ncbi:MAG: GNAT family N-acetyltransferase [Clostridia bacterium]|nr:GNAT family N-acetyltransferase [Clostridia bacterium]
MSNIKIEEVKINDAAFIHDLMNNVRVMDALNEVPTSISDWRCAIAEWMQDSDEKDYIILCDATPIGWIAVNGLDSNEKKAFLKMIALLPEYHGRGIGQLAVHWVIEFLEKLGYISVALYTDETNLKAQNCYLRCGFKVVKSVVQTMSNGKSIKRYKMELCL